ncbi:hypothetical protein [Aeromonas hydrophila]|uniref:hypothetical protein n=1 Tax=Aeromonas hydrophila TaxID=644 RepID=UPI0036DAF41A
MLNNNELIGILSLLRNARRKLLSRSQLENPELFNNFFEFENNFELLNLAFEREFNLWVDGHFSEFDEAPEIGKSRAEIRCFNELMVELVQSRVIKTTSEKNIASREFCISLLSDKILVINELIAVSRKSTKQYQRLLYSYQKDKALFDREFQTLMEK